MDEIGFWYVFGYVALGIPVLFVITGIVVGVYNLLYFYIKHVTDGDHPNMTVEEFSDLHIAWVLYATVLITALTICYTTDNPNVLIASCIWVILEFLVFLGSALTGVLICLYKRHKVCKSINDQQK